MALAVDAVATLRRLVDEFCALNLYRTIVELCDMRGWRAQRIRDPIHDLIEFDTGEFEQVCWATIQSTPFQRLRRIRQLGFSDFVYPGATHSRLAHSLGVFHTARRLAGVIQRIVGGDRYDKPRALEAICAALVHDLGHGPFSHSFEDASASARAD